jgi:uncharacterized protein (TIGR03067 family)
MDPSKKPMRYWMLLVPAVVLLMAADDAEDKDHKALQGTWKITTFDLNGSAATAEDLKDDKMIVKNDSITLSASGRETMRGTFKLNATKKPKTIDVKLDSDDRALGIYELNGDPLKFSFRLARDERPKDFTETDVVRIIVKREK